MAKLVGWKRPPEMIEMKISENDDDERYVNDEKKNCGDDDHDCVDYGYDDDND